jgi:hypothetical protein
MARRSISSVVLDVTTQLQLSKDPLPRLPLYSNSPTLGSFGFPADKNCPLPTCNGNRLQGNCKRSLRCSKMKFTLKVLFSVLITGEFRLVHSLFVLTSNWQIYVSPLVIHSPLRRIYASLSTLTGDPQFGPIEVVRQANGFLIPVC